MEFIFRNPDSTDRFWGQNMKWYICPHCAYNESCRKSEAMPVISTLSRYILRWHSEQKVVPSYPLPGNWENQPVWFSQLMTTASNTYNRLERESMEKKNG